MRFTKELFKNWLTIGMHKNVAVPMRLAKRHDLTKSQISMQIYQNHATRHDLVHSLYIQLCCSSIIYTASLKINIDFQSCSVWYSYCNSYSSACSWPSSTYSSAPSSPSCGIFWWEAWFNRSQTSCLNTSFGDWKLSLMSIL